MSKDNIIGRIRKLLAIADKNSGASENEMMTEMSMAQALMLRHHLSPQVQSKVFDAAYVSVPRTNELAICWVRFLQLADAAVALQLVGRSAFRRRQSACGPQGFRTRSQARFWHLADIAMDIV